MPIVLVHGAWSGGWSWSDAARLLRKRGYEVYNPSLSGLADRNHIHPDDVSLSSHIADIAGLMRYENLRNVLIVGHSYGGMVITGAADREIDRVAGMIYVDAFVPDNGQSLWDCCPPARRDLQTNAAKEHDGGHSIPRTNPNNAPDEATAAYWETLFTPQPIQTFSEPFVSTRDRLVWPPRHYFMCTKDPNSHFRLIGPRFQNAPGWGYGEFDELHDVVRTHPQMVADAIAKVADNWGLKPDIV
jgi:pimeloyl-ACP methyl ester carboxylesterase